MFNGLYRFFTPADALLAAIKVDKMGDVINLLDRGMDVNAHYAGFTPLHSSVVYDKYKITVFLLQRGADPNAAINIKKPQHASYSNKKILETLIGAEDASGIKLLAFYGANPENVNFSHYSYLKPIVTKYFGLFQQRRLLEQQLDAAKNPPERAIKCEKLAALWQQLAEDEKQPDYKQHYFAKALEYQQLQKSQVSKTVAEAKEEPSVGERELAEVEFDELAALLPQTGLRRR